MTFTIKCGGSTSEPLDCENLIDQSQKDRCLALQEGYIPGEGGGI